GIPTAANFQNPNQLGVTADQSFDFTWIDNEQDMTGKFDFFYQSSNVHPLAPVGSPEFMGQMVPGAQQVAISDPANHYLWDTSTVPSGSYYLYEITADAPLPPISGISLAPVTIQHAGDPLYPAVLVNEPDGIGDIVVDSFAIKWIATGEGSGMRAKLSYRSPDAPDP